MVMQMNLPVRNVMALLIFNNAAMLVAQEGPGSESWKRVSAYELVRISAGREISLSLHDKPVINWSNAVFGSAQGSLYLWTDDGRPEVALRTYVNKNGECFENFRSFCTSPVVARKLDNGEILWSPREGAEPMRNIPGDLSVAASRPARLRQMRLLHRRFQVAANLVNAGGKHLLRPLPTPLYRYENDQVIEGAVFGYVHGTAPGVLLFLEARGNGDQARWYYGIGAISIFSIEVELDRQVVWREERRTAPETRPTDLFDSRMVYAKSNDAAPPKPRLRSRQ